jgi:uncharacterized protein (TIGR04141 family)
MLMSIHRLSSRTTTGQEAGTARRSVYRLTIAPTVEAMTAALLTDSDSDTIIETTRRAGCPMVTATGQRVREHVHWRPDYQNLTGLDAVLSSSNPFAAVLIAIDGVVYAVTFGNAAHLLDPAFTDSGFGLRFAARVLNPDQISELISNALTGKSRVESTFMAGGAPISAFGNPMQGNLIRRISGHAKGFQLPTAGRLSGRLTRIVGADYLSLLLGRSAEDMVADLREISKIYETSNPDPRLEWTSWIRHLDKRADATRIAELDLMLGQRLESGDLADVDLAIPVNTLPGYDEINSYRIRTGGATRLLRDLDLEDLLEQVQILNAEDCVPLLRRGWVQPCSDVGATDKTGPKTSAIAWLTCEITIGPEAFVLVEGDWYRIGAAHLTNIRQQITEILDRSAGISLPAWPRNHAREENYLKKVVAEQAKHLLVMDQKRVTSPLHWHGIEACDLLHHQEATVYHVKKATASSPLSHLFAQAVVAHDANHNDSKSRETFARQVKRHHKVVIDPAFRPKKIVLAIKWKDGEQLTATTMPTFAQIALLYAVNALRGVEVFVISIDAA